MIDQTILQGLREFHGALSGRLTSGAHDLQQRTEALTRDERTELQQALGEAISPRAQQEEVRPFLDTALETMGRIEIARDWMRLYLEKHETSAAWTEDARKPSKGAAPQSSPASGSAVSTAEYVCPRGDYRWRPSSAAQAIPRCPIHNVALNEPA
ncbi:MAG: hypothetical protein DLM53_09630 [Candidatus Eremiobacter antarcticus]|nr:hypothetical protein [Candidatus Eremiobacteraeota bacterium]MBC5807467.1 hypothetical protein [Candidatus Eremiobacteraeota bacterium]PZR61472.1 MAG: hypothetical protein DLM53_09630 [Candidatus Eremiobacter sp. RRmetagenome_bin22]